MLRSSIVISIYTEMFPNDTFTLLNASTLELANLCLQELHTKDMDGPVLCASAALYGNLPVLQYLRSVHCPWDFKTCSAAAFQGHIYILQWARENGCDWDGGMCDYAAMSGHLHVLQYAQDNNCPWNEGACSSTDLNWPVDVQEWAKANGLLGHQDFTFNEESGSSWSFTMCQYGIKRNSKNN